MFLLEGLEGGVILLGSHRTKHSGLVATAIWHTTSMRIQPVAFMTILNAAIRNVVHVSSSTSKPLNLPSLRFSGETNEFYAVSNDHQA